MKFKWGYILLSMGLWQCSIYYCSWVYDSDLYTTVHASMTVFFILLFMGLWQCSIYNCSWVYDSVLYTTVHGSMTVFFILLFCKAVVSSNIFCKCCLYNICFCLDKCRLTFTSDTIDGLCRRSINVRFINQLILLVFHSLSWVFIRVFT